MPAYAPLAGTSVGLIGLGLMGFPMARRLHACGASVAVWTRSGETLQAAANEGLIPMTSAAEVVRRSSITILMLVDTPAVASVLHEPERGILAGLRRATASPLIIDMGTTAVSATHQFAAAVNEAGGCWLDAPVSGGVVGATDGTLTIMAGGSDDSFARALPVLQSLGRHITHVGAVAAGQVAKAANQVIVGLTIGAVSEAMALARRAGVEPARLRHALMGGFAASRILDLHGQRMAEGNFAPGGRSVTQRKDLQQALDLAEQLDLTLPATTLCRDLYDQLIAQGDGGLDHSALVRVIDDWPEKS
ncbi:NAD(P)-dependent oxidoreductase [Insolitispirillum peregrinum]|uniref:3-hydroxyisobutyrate dehydrogenase n=1 Tax=Insolitispirillum peregrinum TaxID=80876 RepID=A0A1N7K5D6_9PROT|nr:NAD(P)-dependent oxidoreductase [Insolitispirillum peregrinum]SIS56812.1 3-hydroxyisobutyrate dehydrogenase [Insolitispirillum peregrinum]